MTHTAKHTPGPWVAALGERLNTDVYCTDVQGNRIFIAEFATQADAVLGAAAPAMYEALVETMKVLRSLRDNKEEWYTLVTPELLTAWDKNKAALAQAEGRDK